MVPAATAGRALGAEGGAPALPRTGPESPPHYRGARSSDPAPEMSKAVNLSLKINYLLAWLPVYPPSSWHPLVLSPVKHLFTGQSVTSLGGPKEAIKRWSHGNQMM